MLSDINLGMQNTNAEELANFVRKVIHDQDLSYRKVAAKSGGDISHSAVSEIVNKKNTDPSLSMLEGLAKGLGVPTEKIIAIARGVSYGHSVLVNEIIHYAKNLSEKRQTDLLLIAKTFFKHDKPEAVQERLIESDINEDENKADRKLYESDISQIEKGNKNK